MSNPNELKDHINTKTLNFVLLNIATLGIYMIIWLIKNSETLAQTTKQKITSPTYILWIAMALAWSWGLMALQYMGILIDLGEYGNLSYYQPSAGVITLSLLWYVAWIAHAVLLIVWAFKAKKALQDYGLSTLKMDLRLNTFYLLIFNVLYINYCINDMAEVYRRHAFIRENSTSTHTDSL